MATRVAPAPPERLARTVLEEAGPEVLARIGDPGVAAVIWRRPRDPLLAGWIDALPPDRLPRLRGRVAARDLGAAVRDACVVGVPDPRLGEVPFAAIETVAGAASPSDDELKEWVRKALPVYNVPVAFVAVDELPRNPALKVSLPAVAALYDG